MDSKCLESFLIPVMESRDKSLNSMNEAQYNNFFVKLKSKAFKILKDLCDKYNSDSDFVANKNNGYKLKIVHNSFRTSQVFVSANADYNYYPFATVQYNYTKDAFPKEALATLNKEFKEYIDSDNMKIEYNNYVFYIYFKKYNKLNDIATEGIFNKMKENREAKKAERAAKIEKFERESKVILNKCMSIEKSIVNKYKSKNPKLPFKPKCWIEDSDDSSEADMYTEVYNDEWCMNENDSKYIPEASKVFNAIYTEIKQEIEKQNFDYTVNISIPENNCIATSVYL